MTAAEFQKLLHPDKYQVFLFTSIATVPFCFARHPWFVVNRKGVVTRWEIFWEPAKSILSWGHLHKDFFPPAQGIEKFFYPGTTYFPSRLEGSVEGGEDSLAARMAEHIERTYETYPDNHHYALTGPNSITYAQSVIDAFPESGLKLPWNCYTWAFRK